jgi:glutamate 5-kinase
MRTKLEAAAKASARGIPSVIANGRDAQALAAIVRGECRGACLRSWWSWGE